MKLKLATLACFAALGLSATCAEDNSLTDAQKKDGWKLLFNGKDLDGWSNFKSDEIRPGWKVIEGNLVCADPHNAGDLVTKDQYEWFELELDFKMEKGANSGIIFHITEQEGAVWATGPEIQLEDNEFAADDQKCGWLYALYKPADDPKTGKTIDATKPAGEWNHIRVIIGQDKCEHIINGVSYFTYDLHSDEFKKRVKASKFGSMPNFAKSDKGFIALQGDHGSVTFKNVKIKEIEAK